MMVSCDRSALASRIRSTDHEEFTSVCLARSSEQRAKLAVPVTPASISVLEAELWRIEPGSGIDGRVIESVAILLVGLVTWVSLALQGVR